MERKIKAFLLIIMTVTTTAFAGENGAVVASLDKDRSVLKRKTVSAPLHTETYEYYDICGSCERDLLDQMTQKAVMWHDGVKYDSVTSWKVSSIPPFSGSVASTNIAPTFAHPLDIMTSIPLPPSVLSNEPITLDDLS